MKVRFIFSVLLHSIIVSFTANSFVFIKETPETLFAIIPIFLLTNIFAGTLFLKSKSRRIEVCQHGTVLLYSFYTSLLASVIYHIVLALKTIPDDYVTFIWSAVVCIGVNFIIFWNGIICVYVTSLQLGLKLRIIGLICGLIPIANLVVLFLIIKATTDECLVEQKKERINKKRQNEQICATKYPILLVHGIFFRDTKYFNYWGRIPKELEANGAQIFYGNHSSAASVADSAAELKKRIMETLAESGAEKINIIAHSKGGLDCRYALSEPGLASCVASLTTINTPHKGCLFADYLLTKISPDIQVKISETYNSVLKKFGEKHTDFLAAVNDLTDSRCKQLNFEISDPEGVYCQSFGSVMPKPGSGKFPLNFSYRLAKHFDGANDGLVSENSFAWGESYTLLRPCGKRGISHGDMIDLNRQNIRGFDVREFYVHLVNDLKNKGL